MAKMVELDHKTTLLAQMQRDTGPIVLINTFTVEPEDEQAFLNAWTATSIVQKRQPGFISAQLHKGVGDSRVFVNYAVWESTAALRQAFNNPEFRATTNAYPPGVVYAPHVFQKIAVPGICVA